MNKKIKLGLIASAALVAACASMNPPRNPMTFFVTSVGSGNGANLGGLAGADQHCQKLAESVDAGGSRVWRAYLSASALGGAPAVNARDRIGSGPWQNAKAVVVAKSVGDLHSDNNNLTKQTSITEKGTVVNGRGDKPNTHDMLTGSTSDGRAFPADKDMTCGNWTKSAEGTTMVGHHDRMGTDESAPQKSWNSSHGTKGCSQEALVSTGGAGLFYCFAAR